MSQYIFSFDLTCILCYLFQPNPSFLFSTYLSQIECDYLLSQWTLWCIDWVIVFHHSILFKWVLILDLPFHPSLYWLYSWRLALYFHSDCLLEWVCFQIDFSIHQGCFQSILWSQCIYGLYGVGLIKCRECSPFSLYIPLLNKIQCLWSFCA